MDISSAYKKILNKYKFTLVDIGGRNGLIKPWSNVKELITSVVFEPDKKSYTAENNMSGQVVNIPNVVGAKKEISKFYITKNKSYCSLKKPNKVQLEGTYYFDRNFYDIEKIESVKVNNLKFYLEKYNIDKVDFLKIDIQGAETLVLKNIEDMWTNLLGVFTESYASRLYENGDTIADILNILYSKDMEIHDIKTIAYSTITSSNKENIFSRENLSARPISGYKPRPMVFDILCLKNMKTQFKSFDEEKIRKSIFISCLYDYFDIALDILIKSKKYNIFTLSEYNEIKFAIKFIHKNYLSFYDLTKENLMSRFYKLKKR